METLEPTKRWQKLIENFVIKKIKRFIKKEIYFRVFPPLKITQETMNHLMHAASNWDMEGDYLEFGVATGNSLIAAVRTAERYRLPKMRFYGFDSFEGLPPSKGIDTYVNQYPEGKHAFSLEYVKNEFKKEKVGLDKVTFIKGWYEETLTSERTKRLPLKKAAIIWMDADLYESTRVSLDFITSYVEDGTILYFDDWLAFRGNPKYGEQKAFEEWLAKNPHITYSPYRDHGFWGKSFILHV